MMVQSFGQTESFNNTSTVVKREALYSVKLLDRCKRDYLKLIKKNTELQRWIESILGELKVRPYMGEKLFANFPRCRSIHFGGNSYRIIYRILDEPEDEILILDIGHRSSSYTDLARILKQGK
jgi:addiction module RelE/StbE family toxin